MKKQNNENNSKDSSLLFDVLVYIICLAGILISLNFFRIDLYRTLTRQTKPVGTISYKYKAAQRRFSDRVLWDRLRRESPVYDGDFIRTADLSEATVTFKSGTVIDLAENSFVQLHADEEGDRVDVGAGGVSVNAADSGSSLVLVSGDSRIRVERGAVVKAGLDDGDFQFRVVEGDASFTGESGQEARTIAARYPRPAARFLNPGPGKFGVTFRWDRIDPAEAVRLEIAEDRDFSRVVFADDIAGDTAPVELGTGSWFWRVSAADEGPVSSLDTFMFKIIDASPPVLITPAEDYYYQFRVKRPSVRFQWREMSEVSAYLVEAANNPGMANPALSREVIGTSLYSSELGPGTWYWRVRPVYPAAYEGNAGQAAPGSFRIIQSGDLRSPELQSPADRGMVNIAANRGDLYFSWRSEAEARSYRILISANQDMSNPLIAGTVQDNFYVYRTGETAIRPGQYYWTVLQTDTEGNNSSTSAARSFTALEGEVIQRTVFPPDGYTIGNTMMPDIRFTWKTNLPFETRFQISDRADFSRLELDETAGGETFHGRMLADGVWYWRIHARGSGDAVFETPRKAFTVVSPLPAPVLTAPGPGQRVLVQEGDQALFSWEASPGAEYYQFKLYQDADRTRVLYENSLVEGTRLLIPLETYPNGYYYWTVQGFAAESARSTRRRGMLSGSSFIVRRLFPVNLDYPADGTEIDGLRAYLEPESVRWSQAEPAAASRFILSRDRNFTGRPAAVIDNPPAAFALPPLREGDYYWTVRAETPDGFDISARTSRLFRVLPVPPLPEAENRSPQDETVITGEYLRNNRNIPFSWNPVPGATGYFFTLTKEGEDGELIRTGPLAGTTFTLEDLGLLDLGTFIWRVEAVLVDPARERREDEDDEIIQRGEIGENRFRVDFSLPGRPDVKDPGILYGRDQ